MLGKTIKNCGRSEIIHRGSCNTLWTGHWTIIGTVKTIDNNTCRSPMNIASLRPETLVKEL